MPNTWHDNLKANQHLVRTNAGPGAVTIVSGTAADRAFWLERFQDSRSEVFRLDRSTAIVSIHEAIPKGNFLGTLNAWHDLALQADEPQALRSDILLMSMLFGKGTRLSPFTQSLANCKPRFPTPYYSQANDLFLSIGELSTLYSNLLVHHLRSGGFRGAVVKWGDEVVVPGLPWDTADYRDTDAVRFVWYTDPTQELAREKDWVLAKGDTDQMVYQLGRQARDSLLERARQKQGDAPIRLGVNLGSLAISYDLLDILLDEFGQAVADPQRRVDWDPYAWLALACSDRAEWTEEIAYEAQHGLSGIAKLERDFPEFFDKMTRVRQRLEDRKQRPLFIRVLDYGEPLWLDFGQHLALRKNLAALIDEGEQSMLARATYALPQERDSQGNTILNSRIHPAARIRNSLIINSVIADGETAIDRGVVVQTKAGRIDMPQGGIALFCTAGHLRFDGPNAIAFRAIGESAALPEGGRRTTFLAPETQMDLWADEAITDYKGPNYETPILDNPISFAEAAQLVEGCDESTLEALVQQAEAPILRELYLDDLRLFHTSSSLESVVNDPGSKGR